MSRGMSRALPSLCINLAYGALVDYLINIANQGTIFDLINATDNCGRSALAWTVEHGWAAATATLVKFGADVNQPASSSGLPLLHQAIAG